MNICLCLSSNIKCEIIKRALECYNGINVIATCYNSYQLNELIRYNKPDLLIVDYHIAGLTCYGICCNVAYRHKVKVLTLYDKMHPILFKRLIAIGIEMFENINCGIAKFISTLQLIEAKQYLFDAAQCKLLDCPDKHLNSLDCLTNRELQIFLMRIQGIDSDIISKHLYLSVKTINSYRYKIQAKLALKNDIEMVLLASKLNLLSF